VDGTSATYYWNRGDFGACSRNYDLKEGDTPYWRVAKKYDIFQKMGELHKNIAIQGELMGPSIQKNRYHLKDYDLFVFNAYDIDRQESYSLAELKILCANLGLKMVPILTESYMLPHTMQEILDYANAPSTLYPPMIREGVVIRSIVPMRDIDIGRLSFKVRNNAFLLKYGDD
jgi:RNA ligase (TIGR02306 family)